MKDMRPSLRSTAGQRKRGREGDRGGAESGRERGKRAIERRRKDQVRKDYRQ